MIIKIVKTVAEWLVILAIFHPFISGFIPRLDLPPAFGFLTMALLFGGLIYYVLHHR